MMRALITLCFLSIFQVTHGQVYFNKRTNFGFPLAIITSVLPTDSCYYLTGLITDSLPPYLIGNIFVKLGLDGEYLNSKTLLSTEKTYETWLGDLLPTPDGNFLDIGFTRGAIRKALLVKYSPQGDTLFMKEHPSFYFPQNPFIVPVDFVRMENGEMYVLNVVEKPDFSDGDISVMKLDANGTLVWQKAYGSTWDEIPRSLVLDDYGGLIIGAEKQKIVSQNFVNRTYLIKIDTTGEILWEYLTPQNHLRDAARDMVKTEDGGLVVASGKGIEVPVNATSGDLRWESGHVYKLNTYNQVVWEVDITGDITPLYFNYLSKLISVDNGNAFVTAGQFGELVSPTSVDVYCWLAKISGEGEILWLRKHHIVDSDEDRHFPYDLKQTADGGLIIVGEASDLVPSPDNRQAWLLKLDGHGCLVPGCHLIDATEEEAVPEIGLAIYPNPTTDYLNFYLKNARPSKGTSFRIVDAAGRAVKEFQSAAADATFIVPVWGWAAGVYFLQYIEDGAVRCSERFVKQ